MNKRTFLKTTAVAAAAAASTHAAPSAGAEFFELRTWTLKTAKQTALDDYLSKAVIPAVERAGSGPDCNPGTGRSGLVPDESPEPGAPSGAAASSRPSPPS